MQFLPRVKKAPRLFFSRVKYKLPPALTPKVGLIMWSSTVRLIEMLSLILSPASKSLMAMLTYSHIMQTLILLIE